MAQVAERYRLVTRSDFDGLVCAALLKHIGMLDDVLFVHPKDVQDGKVELTDRDITTNLPYVPGVHLAFDHHASEALRVKDEHHNHVISTGAASAARVVYDYFGGAERFPTISEELMEAVDKADAADFSQEEILALPDLAERIALYRFHHEEAVEQIRECATVHGNLVVLDLRKQEIIFPTNRFTIYALFPECNISMHVLWGLQMRNTVFAVGKSIIDRSSATNVGALMLEFGGGGHDAAGTCQVENVRAASVRAELIARINADG